MEAFTWARIFHILDVVVWIGGVAMVTMIVIPSVKSLKNKRDQVFWFEKIEGKFANVAKVTTLITGATGFFMLYELNAWNRYLDLKFWWIHAMTLVWIIFSLILFILEPLVLHKLFHKYAQEKPVKAFKVLHVAHWVLLGLSIITIIGAVAGSHGLYFF